MNYIFSTGLSRSGTSLLTKMLYESNQASLALGPNVETYRFFRNKLISKYGSAKLKKKVKKFSPIPDYFGSEEGIQLLNLMLNSNLNEKFDKKDWKIYLKKSISKNGHDSPDLLQYFTKLKGNTFKDIILNLLNIIKKKRKIRKNNKRNKNIYYGFNETWNICSLKALATAFPKAKFYVVIRDPRSVFASLSKNSDNLKNYKYKNYKKNEEIHVHLLSLCRHFRKYIILSNYYLSLPLFKNRIMVVKYEDLKTNPKICLKKICKFLKIEFNNNMINPNKYYDFVTKKKWIPHSVFSTKFPKQDNKPIHQWKKYLSDIEVKSIELLCENEMSSMGYKFKFRKNEKNFDKVIQFIKKNYNKKVNWRTDLMDFKKDRYIEHVRYKILNNKIKVNNKLMQKCFLFNNHSLSSLIKHYKEQ